MRAKIIWGTMGIVLFLVLGFATLKIAKATTCEPDGTDVVVRGTWRTFPDGKYCIDSEKNCSVFASQQQIPKDGSLVKLSGTLKIEKTQNGLYYYFDARTAGHDTVWTQCDSWQ